MGMAMVSLIRAGNGIGVFRSRLLVVSVNRIVILVAILHLVPVVWEVKAIILFLFLLMIHFNGFLSVFRFLALLVSGAVSRGFGRGRRASRNSSGLVVVVLLSIEHGRHHFSQAILRHFLRQTW